MEIILEIIQSLTELPKGDAFWVVNVNCKIYSLIYFFKNNTVFVHKYSTITNTWKNMGLSCGHDINDNFRLCAFMDNIFIIGGRDKNLIATSSCIKLNINKNRTEKIKNMNEARHVPACTTFEGRVVVSGGYVNANDHSNTVEAYDHVANTWSSMPNMINSRHCHSLVAVRNKLFVFGGWRTETCEVLDSSVNRFVLLKPPSSLRGFEDISGAISVGSRILIFKNNSAGLISFDFVENEWKEESFEVTKDIIWYFSLKLAKN